MEKLKENAADFQQTQDLNYYQYYLTCQREN